MKQIPIQRQSISLPADSAQFLKEAKHKGILDVSLISKPSKLYAFQQFIRRNL
jgi:hypothetical protein